jgi:hypothetical protein
VYLRSNNSEPRHKHDASTMTDTRRAWSGAETSLSAGPDASVLDPRADIFNSALQRDRLPEKTHRFGLRLVDERNLRGAAHTFEHAESAGQNAAIVAHSGIDGTTLI